MSRSTPRVAPVMLGALVALAVAGCGSSSLSASQLRARATPICKLAARQLSAIPAPALPSGGARFLSQGIAALAPELSRLRALHSTGDRDALAATTAELGALRSTLRGLRAGNDPVVAIKTLQQQLSPLEARADGDWRALGVLACVSR